MLEDKDSYAWAKLNIFTQWRARTRQTAILVFDLNKNYKVGLSFETSAFYGPGQRQQGTREKHSPLWPYTRILDEVAALQNKSVWDIRTLVRKIEKAREVKESRVEEEELLKGEGERYKWKQKPAIDYPGLHDLSRHAIHVCETLDVSTHTTRTILEHHVRFMDEQQQLLRQGPATGATNGDEAKARRVTSGAVRNVHETLQHMGHMVESLRHRSSSNKARLLNEIQLCYHMASDYDSGTSVQIAAATRSDSADMRTVAYLTLTFLPATFISALFGSSFFSFEQSTGTWAMSPKFWIYWATTVPATAATVAVWYVWKNRSLPPALSRRATGFEGGAVVSLKVKMRELMKRIDSDKMKEEV